MSYKVEIEIDIQEAFDNLRRNEKEEFINDNLDAIDEDYLIEYLINKGYNVNKE